MHFENVWVILLWAQPRKAFWAKQAPVGPNYITHAWPGATGSQNYNFKIIKIIMAIILALDLMWDKWCLFVVGLIKEHHPHQDPH